MPAVWIVPTRSSRFRAAIAPEGGDDSGIHRTAWSVVGRPAPPRRGAQVPHRERHPADPRRLGRSARRLARQDRDGAGFRGRARHRLQHQRRDHDARFRQCAHLLVVHARRRHGARRDDGLAQSHHRARPRHLSPAAMGAEGRLGAVRRIFQQWRAVSFLAAPGAAPAAQAARRARHGLRGRARDRVVPGSHRRPASGRRAHRLSGRARPAVADRAARAGVLLSLRNQHGPDAAGDLGARRRVREDAPAAALDRERMGPRPAGVHVRGAAGTRSRRPRHPVPHRHPADLPPHGLSRVVHVPAGAQGLLRQRLAPAPVGGRHQERAQPVHAGGHGRLPVAARPALSRRLDEPCAGLRGVRRRPPSTAIAATGRIRSRPTAPPGVTTTAA